MENYSDFDEKYFNAAEKRDFQTLLMQMRSFERTVSHAFRAMEKRLDALEAGQANTKGSLKAVKGTMTKLKKSINQKLEDMKKGKLPDEDELEASSGEEEANDGEENDNGPEVADASRHGNGGLEEEAEEAENNDVMVTDPFLGNGFIGTYDGDPKLSFNNWAERFKDVLSLLAPLDDQQKLARLRFCLAGPARDALDALHPAPDNVEDAIVALKAKFNNGSSKVLAAQSLAILKQAPGESVFNFAKRLSDTVKNALSGESEPTISRILLNEFMNRLQPNLEYEVKAQRPDTYAAAYELALHYELLQAGRRQSADISLADLAQKVEAIAFQAQRPPSPGVKKCYYCRRPNHVIRDCLDRARDLKMRMARSNNANGQYNENLNYNRSGYGNDENYDEWGRKDNYAYENYGQGSSNGDYNRRTPSPVPYIRTCSPVDRKEKYYNKGSNEQVDDWGRENDKYKGQCRRSPSPRLNVGRNYYNQSFDEWGRRTYSPSRIRKSPSPRIQTVSPMRGQKKQKCQHRDAEGKFNRDQRLQQKDLELHFRPY
jgi:hypothetical protein